LRRRADSMPDRPRTYALAESCARRAVTLAPPRLYNQSELALILLLRAQAGVAGADSQAVAAVERCAGLGPCNPSPPVHFSEMALVTGPPDLVLRVIPRAIALHPREALPHELLGEALLAPGDRPAARAALEHSLTLEWRGNQARKERATQLLGSSGPMIFGR